MTIRKRTFTYEEALERLPDVQRITAAAAGQLDELLALDTVAEDEVEIPQELVADYERIVSEWAEKILALGVEIKGLWLVDFDSGAGYYCWRHPEETLEYFHGYEEGYKGRVKLN
jgi:hypothetical protein